MHTPLPVWVMNGGGQPWRSSAPVRSPLKPDANSRPWSAVVRPEVPCMDGARGARGESDVSANRSGAAMYPAFECSRFGCWPWCDPLSGPNQKHALFARVALRGFSDRRSRPFRINVVITLAVQAYSDATS